MYTRYRSAALVLAAVIVLLIAVPAFARAQAGASNVSVHAVVTALGPDYSPPPPIMKDDVTVYSAKTKLNVTGWEPAKAGHGALELAILIDDAVAPSAIGLQFQDLKNFMQEQPSDVSIGIFYAQFGTVTTAAKFSTDHAEVARRLRLPLGGRAGSSPSIYLSLSDLVKKWPGDAPRREVLMLTSGLDRLEPGVQDPYFDAAVNDVQRSGVNVYSIYVGPLRLGLSFFGMIAQGNLGHLTSESGGDAFFQGVSTPVSFKPFLGQLNTILQNQYLVTFEAPASAKAKGDLRPISIRTEQAHVRLLYPHRVFIPSH
ncbi:MAG: hypothetical protein KGL02_00940 [Acidobacteriota bacterium]|nr:hypothetical protein [Acidobacteriota bacterium]MDE3169817.1 hypothetical protein [Acidobacteriota bacterium]